LIFPSEAGQRLYATALKLARVDTTVLLQGETGSGKTCVARLIHESSPRRGKPFVVVNCGSLPESLLEGELFGFRQGAYTGADRNHRGKCAQAEDGTLFLDEIDSLSLKAQSSLLRVVEDRSFEPLGSDRTEKLRARLVFATNRDLAQEVAAGHFRQDLYYRLNVVALTIPALRARRAAIPLLVDAFLQELRERRVTEVKAFSGDALAVMSRYSWPGNLRELRNVVERVAVLTDREIVTEEELTAEICLPTGGGAMVTEKCVELEDSQSSTSHLQGARRSACRWHCRRCPNPRSLSGRACLTRRCARSR
jgi:two-component system response regulator HydG